MSDSAANSGRARCLRPRAAGAVGASESSPKALSSPRAEGIGGAFGGAAVGIGGGGGGGGHLNVKLRLNEGRL